MAGFDRLARLTLDRAARGCRGGEGRVEIGLLGDDERHVAEALFRRGFDRDGMVPGLRGPEVTTSVSRVDQLQAPEVGVEIGGNTELRHIEGQVVEANDMNRDRVLSKSVVKRGPTSWWMAQRAPWGQLAAGHTLLVAVAQERLERLPVGLDSVGSRVGAEHPASALDLVGGPGKRDPGGSDVGETGEPVVSRHHERVGQVAGHPGMPLVNFAAQRDHVHDREYGRRCEVRLFRGARIGEQAPDRSAGPEARRGPRAEHRVELSGGEQLVAEIDR